MSMLSQEKNSRTSIFVADEIITNSTATTRRDPSSQPESAINIIQNNKVLPNLNLNMKIDLSRLENKNKNHLNSRIYPLSTRNAPIDFEDDNSTPKKKCNPRLKKALREKRVILNSLMQRCESEIQNQSSFQSAFKEYQKAFSKQVVKTKPTHEDYNRKKLLEECKYTLEIKRGRHQKTSSIS